VLKQSNEYFGVAEDQPQKHECVEHMNEQLEPVDLDQLNFIFQMVDVDVEYGCTTDS